jgi:aryl-alcohol dehydrogenase-like predicted oxidoreductase
MDHELTRRSLLGAAGATVVSAIEPGPAAAAPAGQIGRRRLGRTGVQVSMLGLGGHHIGRKDEQTGIRLVHMAIDNGIDFLDNCWDYNDGNSEAWMGKALEKGRRQKAFLMTKLDGRTRDSATRQLTQSLQRLRTDVIDLVQIHEVIRMEDAERSFAPGGAIEALVDARKAGKLRFIGFTGHKDPKIHLHMLSVAKQNGFDFDTVQMPLNLMDAHFRSFEKAVLPVLRQRDIGVLGMKSMGDGLLLESKAVTARECLRYALSLPTSVVITGCESEAILQQAIDVGRSFKPLEPAELRALLARTAPVAKDGKYEKFKTTAEFDGTAKNPKWLDSASL